MYVNREGANRLQLVADARNPVHYEIGGSIIDVRGGRDKMCGSARPVDV